MNETDWRCITLCVFLALEEAVMYVSAKGLKEEKSNDDCTNDSMAVVSIPLEVVLVNQGQIVGKSEKLPRPLRSPTMLLIQMLRL
jgi:hypothetical protein